MEKVFVIGDIHGSFDLLEKLLPKWNPQEEQLVFLGDYIDRGPESLKVLLKVMELKKDFNAICLGGNHEQIFLNWLEKPEEISEFYFNQKVGGIATVESFNVVPPFSLIADNISVKELTKEIQSKHQEVIQFVKQLRTFYHWEPFLFVHAGIDASVADFKETKNEDFLWIREEFYSVPHKAEEIVVFGHTPTPLLNEDKSSQVWVSSCQRKIGIDGGGAIYEKGLLHGLVFSKGSKEIVVHSASREEEVYSTKIQL